MRRRRGSVAVQRGDSRVGTVGPADRDPHRQTHGHEHLTPLAQDPVLSKPAAKSSAGRFRNLACSWFCNRYSDPRAQRLGLVWVKGLGGTVVAAHPGPADDAEPRMPGLGDRAVRGGSGRATPATLSTRR